MSSIPPTVPPPPGGGSYVPPPPPPPSGTGGAGGDRAIFLVLSYLGILSLIPFFVKKDDPEVQWHAKNGVVLFGAEVVWVVLVIAIHFANVTALSCVTGIVNCIVWIGFIALSIVCIVKAVNGQRFRIPMLTDMAEKM